ncbi:MAG: DUF4386 domain-containing protein [Actinomycetota bacterium]|nr:DUF4386 domain-containing protein [Actinomycetota bacterium]
MTTAADRLSGTAVTVPGSFGRRSRLLAALILPLGPAAIAVLRLVLPYFTIDEPTAMAAEVAGNPGAQSLVVWLGLVAAIAIVPAVIWIGGLTRPSAPVVTAFALALAVPGYLALGVIMSTDVMLWSGIRNGVDAQTVAHLVANTHPAVGLAEGIFVLGHLVGTVLLGVALWRSRIVPRWAAGMTAISQPLHLVAAVFLVNPTLDFTAWMMTALGFVAAGLGSGNGIGRNAVEDRAVDGSDQ